MVDRPDHPGNPLDIVKINRAVGAGGGEAGGNLRFRVQGSRFRVLRVLRVLRRRVLRFRLGSRINRRPKSLSSKILETRARTTNPEP